MLYIFEGNCFKEGNRHFIKIPFNVWEVCQLKGNIPVIVTIETISFECKLVPKGYGDYYIPITIKQIDLLGLKDSYCGSFEIIKQLSRINHDSPYSITRPIRKIDAIKMQYQPDVGLCGQTCVAMLSDLPIKEVIKIMQAKKWQASLSKVIETLDYFGFKHANKMVYKKEKFSKLPNLCLINAKPINESDKHNHLLLYFNNIYYDPLLGMSKQYDNTQIISYLEIYST